MKKIVKIIALSLSLATTTFAMDGIPETLESETHRVVFQTINALDVLQPNLFLGLAQAHIDDPETAALFTALFKATSLIKEEFFPSIMRNLQTLRTKFDSSSLGDIENGGIPLLYVTDSEMQKFLNGDNSAHDESLYEPLYASDEDEGLLTQKERTHTATNNDLLELNDSDDEEDPKQKEIIDSSLAASAAKSDDKSELPSDIL